MKSRMAGVLNLCFSIFKGIFAASALFQRAAAARFRKKRRKIFHKVKGTGLLVFTNQWPAPFLRSKRALRMEVYCMCEENTSQKERFLQEVEQKLLRKELDARLLEDGLIHVKWNGQPLCSVDRDGINRAKTSCSKKSVFLPCRQDSPMVYLSSLKEVSIPQRRR